MQRAHFSILAGLSCFFAVAACSENPNDLKRLGSAQRAMVITSTKTLDESILELLALFPKSLDQRDPEAEGADLNPRATWDQIKKKYATGQSKTAHMAIAKRKLVRISDWVTRNTPLMSPPPDPETRIAAASRLVLYMNMYVYGGPGTTPPPYAANADVAVGIVTPDAAATIVTPTLHAGVQFEPGSVAENTVIVITQNPAAYPDNCSGPLQTKLCQYPQFYTFSQFPEQGLLKSAKINVCHVNSGDNRLPLADHSRFRLAHTKPESELDYTPGSTIRFENGENIEILPLVEQSFSHCEENSYGTEIVGSGQMDFLSRMARGLRRIVTPRTAYAVDVGLGGIVKKFSPFNIVDSLSTPDLAVQSFDAPESPVPAGNHFAVAYSVKNIGTATGVSVPVAIRLRIPVGDGLFTSVEIGRDTLPSLVPGATESEANFEAAIPASLAAGNYSIRLIVASDPTFPDANFADNEVVVGVTVEQSLVSLPRTLSVGSYSACALTAGSVGYCWGSNDRRQFGTSTATPAGSSSPFAAPIPSFATLSGGNAQHFCGITSSGSAMCWGRPDFGALGSGVDLFGVGSVPVTVAAGISWRTINVSRLTTCGVSTSNVGYCWGHNQRGEIGSASIPIGSGGTGTSTPHVIDGGHSWESVVTGWLHACGITTNGVAYCWGDNQVGQLGIGSANVTPQLVPVPVLTTDRFIQLSLGTQSTCGITVNHRAFCWGENGTGQIGDGTTTFKTVPTPVAGGFRFSYIAVSTGFAGDGTDAVPPVPAGTISGVGHTCALTETGQSYCWGWNGSGQVGDGTTTDRLTPQPVAGGFTFTSIGLGGSASCGQRANQIWCWGSNLVGQLGNGTMVNSLTPSLVSSPFNTP